MPVFCAGPRAEAEASTASKHRSKKQISMAGEQGEMDSHCTLQQDDANQIMMD